MTTTRTEQISVPDGSFAAHLTLPDAGHGSGVLVIQEVFGVNDYIRSVAERLAGIGYVAMAPDVFWRVDPGFELDSSTPDSIEPAIAVANEWDPDTGLGDLVAAFGHLRDLDEVTGPVAVIGFCFGGTQAMRLAKEVGPACAVSYYGSGVADELDDIERLTAPIMFHFGDADPYLPSERVAELRAATEGMNNVQIHVHAGGGHAFDNHTAPHFSQPDLAAAAWNETAAFLFMHLGGPGIGA